MEATAATSAAPKARVLFVDDEPRVLTTMRMLFRGRYDMLFAEGGQKALEILRTTPVDVIVSDQRMPGMTGIEMLRTARELNPNAMRILLTGYSDLSAIIGSVNEGEIFRFVNKPWNNEDLTATVARAVSAAKGSVLSATRQINVAAEGAGKAGPGILVLDDDPNVPGKIQALLGSDFRVYGATSMSNAVGMLEKERIGVVISETRVENHPVIDLISTLKRHHPDVVSVILTDRADAGQAIELINEGQIYRFITKPIHDTQAQIAIKSAARHHGTLSSTPELHKRYEPAPAKETRPASTASAGLLDRLKSIRSWVRRTT